MSNTHNSDLEKKANILETIIDDYKQNSQTHLTNLPKPTKREIADTINEIYEKGAIKNEDFSNLAGLTKFSHKNIVYTAEMNSKSLVEIPSKVQSIDLSKDGDETLKKLLTMISNKNGVALPQKLELRPFGLFDETYNMAMSYDGNLKINVYPALLDEKRKNFGYSLPSFLNSIYHELQHRKQSTYTNEYLNGNTNIPQKYEFLSKIHLMESCLLEAKAKGLIISQYLSTYKYYFHSLSEVDARVTAAKELIGLMKNPYLDADIKKQLFEFTDTLMVRTFGRRTFVEKAFLKKIEHYTKNIILDFSRTFGNIPHAQKLLNSISKKELESFISEVEQIQDELKLMQEIYQKNKALDLKHQATNLKRSALQTVKNVNEIIHKTPQIARETLSATKNLPRNACFVIKRKNALNEISTQNNNGGKEA